eukprot:6199955-Pleurochrysis_carterae.AAC.3
MTCRSVCEYFWGGQVQVCSTKQQQPRMARYGLARRAASIDFEAIISHLTAIGREPDFVLWSHSTRELRMSDKS